MSAKPHTEEQQHQLRKLTASEIELRWPQPRALVQRPKSKNAKPKARK